MNWKELYDEAHRVWDEPGVTVDLRRVENLLQQAADAAGTNEERSRAMYSLAYLYCHYPDEPALYYPVRARAYFQRCIDLNPSDSSSLYQLGLLCKDGGPGILVEPERAFSYFRRSAELGNTSAALQLGHCYRIPFGAPQDYEKAAEQYRKAMEKGNKYACFYLALCYNKLNPQDDRRMEAALLEGIARGDKRCVFTLARLRSKTEDDSVRNIPAAVAVFESIITEGDPTGDAHLQMGLIHLFGRGTYPVDREKACAYFRTAADRGNESGWFWLGHFYRDGDVLEKDLVQAEACFRKAKAFKLSREVALERFGTLSEKGQLSDVTERFEKKQYRAVADMLEVLGTSVSDAALASGVMCELGWGRDTDPALAAERIEQAAAMGNDDAEIARKLLQWKRELNCPCCGRRLERKESRLVCLGCNLKIDRTFADEESYPRLAEQINEGNRLRQQGKHEEAMARFDALCAEHTEPLFLFCHLLARFGVRFVAAPVLFHIERMNYDSFLLTPEGKRLLADPLTKSQGFTTILALLEKELQQMIRDSRLMGMQEMTHTILWFADGDDAAAKWGEELFSGQLDGVMNPFHKALSRGHFDPEVMLSSALQQAQTLVVCISNKSYSADARLREILARYRKEQEYRDGCIAVLVAPEDVRAAFPNRQFDYHGRLPGDREALERLLAQQKQVYYTARRNRVLYALMDTPMDQSAVTDAFNWLREVENLPYLSSFATGNVESLSVHPRGSRRLRDGTVISLAQNDGFKCVMKWKTPGITHKPVRQTWKLFTYAGKLLYTDILASEDGAGCGLFTMRYILRKKDGTVLLPPNLYYIQVEGDGFFPTRMPFAVVDDFERHRIERFANQLRLAVPSEFADCPPAERQEARLNLAEELLVQREGPDASRQARQTLRKEADSLQMSINALYQEENTLYAQRRAIKGLFAEKKRSELDKQIEAVRAKMEPLERRRNDIEERLN